MKKLLIFMAGVFLLLYPWISNLVTQQEQREMIAACEASPPDEVLGSIKIPKIHVQLPIYRGTEEETLRKGVGHISWSSLPIGGESNHSLLAGHRGLPGAQLFTRLNELEEGDLFVIETKEDILTYAVCDIQVVKPEETEKLGVQQGRDLVSLITCTPYGINTHRLIVTGERMEENQ